MKSFDGVVEALARLDSKSRLFARCRFSMRLEVENFGDLSPNPEVRTGPLGPVIKGVNESSREFDTEAISVAPEIFPTSVETFFDSTLGEIQASSPCQGHSFSELGSCLHSSHPLSARKATLSSVNRFVIIFISAKLAINLERQRSNIAKCVGYSPVISVSSLSLNSNLKPFKYRRALDIEDQIGLAMS